MAKTDLFEARKGGYRTYRIPGIVVARSGAVLAYAEARKRHGGDWDDIDILMRRSLDGGITWEKAKAVVSHGSYGRGPANNPCAIADHETGSVHFLYGYNYARVFYQKSDDDGVSFSSAVEITSTFEGFRPEYDWGVLATGPGHGIQLKSGRLIAPVWLSESKSQAHHPNRCSVIYSDDHGATWHRGEMVPDVIPCCNETEAVQLDDGSVLLNMRNRGHQRRRAIAVSADGPGRPPPATGWSTPRLDNALLEPRCFGSVCRLTEKGTEDRNRLLFSNPDNVHTRKNLTVKMSYDEGKTWPVSKVLEAGDSGYSDLAVAGDKMILCLYERGNLDSRPHYLTLAWFNLEWLADEEDYVQAFLPGA
jgi:sialidase-1